MYKFNFFVVLCFLISFTTLACIEKDDEFVPNGNSLSIPTSYINPLNNAPITEAQFNKVTDEVTKIYYPIVINRGALLKVNKLWEKETVNANASRRKNLYVVNMYGGLARHPLNTIDGYTLVLCHELGHHLGGKPFVNSWASNEGQSDYFATAKCLRKYFSKKNNQLAVSKMTVPATVQEECFKSFGLSKDHALCVRSAMAGLALSNVLDAMNNKSMVPGLTWGKASQSDKDKIKGPDFTTTDPKIVKITNPRHPKAQCRLDTYFAGALCHIPSHLDLSPNYEKIGACLSGKSARPACWYAEVPQTKPSEPFRKWQ